MNDRELYNESCERLHFHLQHTLGQWAPSYIALDDDGDVLTTLSDVTLEWLRVEVAAHEPAESIAALAKAAIDVWSNFPTGKATRDRKSMRGAVTLIAPRIPHSTTHIGGKQCEQRSCNGA